MKTDPEKALEAIARRDLDAFGSEEVAELEARLNADPVFADRLAALLPPVEPALRSAIELPPKGAWDATWRRIDAAAARSPRPASARRVLRVWWPVMAAAAACVLMVGTWSLVRWGEVREWPVEWARSVEIDQLEVANGETAIVLGGGSDEAISVIWVLDDDG